MWFLVNFHEAKNSIRFKQVAPSLAVSVKQLLFNNKTNDNQFLQLQYKEENISFTLYCH